MEVMTVDMASLLVAGGWSLNDAPVLDALRLVREALGLLPPGALQLRRDDAVFYFTQGRALTLPGSSFDVGTIRDQSPFRVEIVRVPWPDPRDPRFGHNVLGPAYEAANAGQMAFGVTRRSRQPERAVDFLRYLTSVPGATRFAAVSGWLPPIVGVPPGEGAEPFMPEARGYPGGFGLNLGSETGRVFGNVLHRLTATDANVESFARELAPAYRAAAEQDVRRNVRQVFANATIHDTTMGAHWLLQDLASAEAATHAARVAELTETQIFQEEASYRRLLDVAEGAGTR
jgi:ABC-type glycerol-3-phosphate transport system substrate-binding protein